MFTILIIRKFDISYYAVLHGKTLVHTCMSEAGARYWVKKRQQTIQALTR